jgi:membrane-associated phospholipid phosphatase
MMDVLIISNTSLYKYIANFNINIYNILYLAPLMLDKLLDYDYFIFAKIHAQWHNAFLDFIFPYLRNPFFWSPLYLFLVVFMFDHFGKKGLLWALFFLLSFGLGDFFSARLLKPIVHRIRPCIDPMWAGIHRHIVPDSHGFSFPSSHATNHFAMGMFIIITCGKFDFRIKYLCFIWAAAVAYAQVYVGVHYPIDVTCGAMLGCWIGYITGNYFNTKNKL